MFLDLHNHMRRNKEENTKQVDPSTLPLDFYLGDWRDLFLSEWHRSAMPISSPRNKKPNKSICSYHRFVPQPLHHWQGYKIKPNLFLLVIAIQKGNIKIHQ
jgi:hypothetical protein